MPIVKCSKDGISGYKWGEDGHCFIGENAKTQAENQGRALMSQKFEDVLIFDSAGRTVISCRDGFQEYYGIELGLMPQDKVFKVYRSPETIFKVNGAMKMIPITNNHIEIEDVIPEELKDGFVTDSIIIPNEDDRYNSTVAIQNTITLSDRINEDIKSGKIELSLGYTAQLVSHPIYDFEQIDIVPHHLAVVNAGRCGGTCKFIDERNEMKNKFIDADGVVSIAMISELINSLPEAFSKMDVEEVKKLAPILKQAIESISSEEPTTPAMEKEPKEEIEDKEPMTEPKAEEVPPKEDFKDSVEFKDTVQKFADARVEVILKAKNFLDESYEFKDKCNSMIMKDTLAIKYPTKKFEDSEISVAFKLLELEPIKTYQNFGDSKTSNWDNLKNKEI